MIIKRKTDKQFLTLERLNGKFKVYWRAFLLESGEYFCVWVMTASLKDHIIFTFILSKTLQAAFLRCLSIAYRAQIY